MAPSRALRPLRNVCKSCVRRQLPSRPFSATSLARDTTESTSHLPKVAQPGFWTSLLPKSLRSSSSADAKTVSKPWNPSTIFIFLGILVGSNSIQIIALRNEMLNFSRKTDAKLSLLRGVVQRVKEGEDVDVRGLLGTGDEKAEGEWEEVLKELADTDMVAEGRRKREERRREKAKRREEIESEERKRRKEGKWAEIPGEGEGEGAAKGEREGGGRPKFIM